MPTIDQFTTSVLVNNSPLPEYPYDFDSDLEATPDTTRVYIEASESQQFVIRCTVSAGYRMPINANGIGFELKIDGGWMAEPVVQFEAGRAVARDRDTKIASVVRYEADKHYTNYLRFRALNITQENVAGEAVEKYNTKGSIRVRVWHWKGEITDSPYKSFVEDRDNDVPEKALKGRAITLGVGLDRGNALTGLQRIFDGRRAGMRPVATFIFEYRTKKSLQDLLILPRSPTPQHISLTDRDPATLTAAEVQQLMDQVRETQDVKTKQEPTTVKRERPTYVVVDDEDVRIVSVNKRVKTVRPEDIIVID